MGDLAGVGRQDCRNAITSNSPSLDPIWADQGDGPACQRQLESLHSDSAPPPHATHAGHRWVTRPRSRQDPNPSTAAAPSEVRAGRRSGAAAAGWRTRRPGGASQRASWCPPAARESDTMIAAELYKAFNCKGSGDRKEMVCIRKNKILKDLICFGMFASSGIHSD